MVAAREAAVQVRHALRAPARAAPFSSSVRLAVNRIAQAHARGHGDRMADEHAEWHGGIRFAREHENEV